MLCIPLAVTPKSGYFEISYFAKKLGTALYPKYMISSHVTWLEIKKGAFFIFAFDSFYL